MAEATTTIEETPEPLSVDWQQGKDIGACMLEMYDRCLWTDVMFHCKDHEEGGTTKAHKIVLAARSPVFQAMFFGPCADGKDKVNLKHVESDIFLLFLRFIYSDTVSLTEENVTAVLQLAHCYQVSNMVQYCADYLATVITSENACEILTIAMQYQISSLKDKCCTFIDYNAQQVFESEGFLNLSEEYLLFILKGDTLYAKEEHILQTAEKWCKKRLLESGMAENGSNIRTLLGKSFYQLRLPTMTNKAFMEYTSRKGYFSLEEYADISGWINKVPDTKVSTNSCVARVPKLEIIQVNAEDGIEVTTESIVCRFAISVSKDVQLAHITLSEVKPQLMHAKCFFDTQPTSIATLSSRDNVSAFLRNRCFDQTVARLIPVDNNGSKIYASVLFPHKDIFPGKLELTGAITIYEEDVIEFEHSFKIQQQQNENGTVTLTTPLLLKKRNDPYLISFRIRYNCGMKIKSRGNKSTEPISNSGGTIKIQNRYSVGVSFSGVKNIGFLNFSNRDKDPDTKTSEKKQK